MPVCLTSQLNVESLHEIDPKVLDFFTGALQELRQMLSELETNNAEVEVLDRVFDNLNKLQVQLNLNK